MTVTRFPYGPDDGAPAAPDRSRSTIELMPAFIDLAARIAKTEFVPTGLRNRPEAVLAALMSGAERGLGPMESLRSINVIEGKPSLSAEAMRALVLAAGHDIEILESTSTRATVVGRRAGSDATSPPFTWTIEDARRAKLAQRGPWQSYPKAMLLARASTDLCRAVFPDVIAGLASIEEASDLVAVAAPTTMRRARRSTAPVDPPAAPTDAPSGQSAVGKALTDAGMIETPRTIKERALTGDLTDAELADERDAVARATAGDGSLGGIPGSDRPSWGGDAPPAPAGDPPLTDAPDASLARRIHAEIGKAFPDADAATQARYRHALVAVITRKRGPVASSSLLTLEEQLALSDALAKIMAGTWTVTDEPDDAVMLRAGRWHYVVTWDPLTVEAVTGTSSGDGAGTTTDSLALSLDVDET